MLPITVIPTRISSHYRANRINPLEFEWIESNRDRRPNRKIAHDDSLPLFLFLIFPFAHLNFRATFLFFSLFKREKFQKKKRKFQRGPV